MSTLWQTRKLKEITTKIGSGSTPRGGEAVYKTSGVPLIRSMNVHFAGFKTEGITYLDDSEAAKLDHVIVQPDDVLLNITGASIGRVTTAPASITGSRVNQHVCIIRPKTDLSPRYLAHYLASPSQQARVMSVQVGVTRQALTKAMVENWEIPLPPLDEQQQIVAEIEKQFTRLEAGVTGLRRVQANLKRYRAAVLKAACEGKLVPTEAELARQEGRTYETGAELLEHILAERRQKWSGKGKYKEAATPDTDLPPLPEGWTWAIVEQVALRVTYGVTIRPKYVDTGIRLISAREIAGGTVNLRIAKMIAETDFTSLRDKCRIYQNDVLFSKTGTIGKVARVSTDERLAASQNIAVISPLMNSLLLQYILMSPRIQDLARQSVKITAIPDLQLGQLSSFPIPLPPLDEQKRIVAEVERCLSVVEELEAVVSANLRRATRLRQSILQQAFEGRLIETKLYGHGNVSS